MPESQALIFCIAKEKGGRGRKKTSMSSLWSPCPSLSPQAWTKDVYLGPGRPRDEDTYGADEGGVHHLHEEPHGRRLVLQHELLALGGRERVSPAGVSGVSPPGWVCLPQLTLLMSGAGSIAQPFSSTSPSSSSVSFFSSSLSK